MSLKAAIEQRDTAVQAANHRNAAVMATLPADPERGSYHWWARLARQNTGSHFLDSGAYYGYGYEQPVLPESVLSYLSVYKGEADGARINTIAWLAEATDASDPTAVAMEKVLYHIVENWPKRKGESWFSRLDGFRYDLAEFLSDPAPDVVTLEELELLNDVADSFVVHHDNTYNHDTDLDQDIGFFLFSTGCDVYDDTWAAIMIHTGCDIRGGYARPAFAKIDPDRFYCYLLPYYCLNCKAEWGDCYDFADAWGATRGDDLDCVAHLGGQPIAEGETRDADTAEVTLTCPACRAQSVVLGLLW